MSKNTRYNISQNNAISEYIKKVVKVTCKEYSSIVNSLGDLQIFIKKRLQNSKDGLQICFKAYLLSKKIRIKGIL